MKPMSNFTRTFLILGTLVAIATAGDPPATSAINGVKGVKQEAVESVRKIEPPTVNPITQPAASAVNKVEGVNTVTVPGQAPAAAPPLPASAGNTAQGVTKVEGIKAVPPNAVQAVAPPPAAGAVSSIRALRGVQGIIAPKQLNLEAALQLKEDGTKPPPGVGEGGKAAAAALLSGPPGLVPAPPTPNGDGREGFQEFEKLTAPGS